VSLPSRKFELPPCWFYYCRKCNVQNEFRTTFNDITFILSFVQIRPAVPADRRVHFKIKLILVPENMPHLNSTTPTPATTTTVTTFTMNPPRHPFRTPPLPFCDRARLCSSILEHEPNLPRRRKRKTKSSHHSTSLTLPSV
jgi:hypothetical protein